MGIAMYIMQPLSADVSINLGGRQRNVTKKLLDGPEVCARFK